MSEKVNIYKTMSDIYRMTPKTLDECEMASEFLKELGTPEAIGAMEMVVMLRMSIEWILKNGSDQEKKQIRQFDRDKYEGQRDKMRMASKWKK